MSDFQSLTNRLAARVRWFRHDQSGAAVVDWVVLTAGLVAVSIAVMASISDGSQTLAENVGTELETREMSQH